MDTTASMNTTSPLNMPLLPKPVWFLVIAYFIASLVHFAHNAEYIVFYPGMPDWLTREKVYMAWLAVTAVGTLGIAALYFGATAFGTAILAAYGALGLDGLAHYTLALCSEHTLAANITIWTEVVLGFCLLLIGAVLAVRHCVHALHTRK